MTATPDSEAGLRGRAAVAVAGALFLVTVALFGRAIAFDFVNYDDDVYVYQNPQVTAGLNWDGVRWAFSTGHAGNWHPLTWLSLQADVSLFGAGPRGHHAGNIALHATAAAVLLLALNGMTGHLLAAAVCAGLFALHPLRVESVAWIAERKDVLCGLCWVLTLLAYAHYAPRPSVGRYLPVATGTVLALLAKPMAVTLPFVLLLLDYWPLRRRGIGRLLLEKLPLLAMSAVAAAVTLWAQRRGGAITGQAMSLGDRLITAVHGYARYVQASFWPVGLAPFYPHPQQPPEPGLPWHAVTSCSLVLAVLLGLAIVWIRRAPWVSVGIFWFLGTLVPVIGLVQVGLQSHADRYTYIPSIGLAIAVVWTARAFLRPRVAAGIAIVILITLAGLTVRQVGIWRDSETLWRHAIAVVPRNYIAHGNLGHALHARGDRAGAMEQFRRSIEINPRYGQGLHNYGAALAAAGKDDQALPLLRRALEVGDTRAATVLELDRLLQRRHQPEGAIALYEAQLRSNANDPVALHGLATLRAQRGDIATAIDLWRRAVAVDGSNPEVQHGLGLSLSLTGQHREGVEHLRVAAAIRPGRVDTLTWLAWTLATTPDAAVRNPTDALAFAQRAMEAAGEPSVMTLDALAAAQAANGRFDEALATVRRAVDRATASNQPSAVETLEQRRRLYEARRAYVQPSP